MLKLNTQVRLTMYLNRAGLAQIPNFPIPIYIEQIIRVLSCSNKDLALMGTETAV